MEQIENGNQKEQDYLFWQFDVSTFRLLGRELITDRITALFELVKNSYDANSTKVTIKFIDVNPISANSKIIIVDNGIGMSVEDIKTKWMVIGTSNKRLTRISPAPFKRKLVGKKGVGRFAVDKLGSKLILKTKQVNNSEISCLELNWNEYEEASKVEYKTGNDISLFTKVRNKFEQISSKNEKLHGLRLEIRDIHDVWTEQDIERSYNQLSKIVSPFSEHKSNFDIYIESQYTNYANIKVKNRAIDNATEKIVLKYNESENLQEVLRHNSGQLLIEKVPYKIFGPVIFRLLYFDQEAKRKFVKDYQGTEKIDGIKIYRDSIIATPFAEYAGTIDEQRDILGIDKRRWSGFFDKISSRDLIGYMELTDSQNPDIIDATNRQEFVDNKQYQELKKFIIDQIIELEEYLTYNKRKVAENTKSGLKNAQTDIKELSNLVREIKRTAPKGLKEKLVLLEKQAIQVQVEVKRGLKAFNELQKEKIRQENLFMSLMSLQDYAFEIAHVINTSLSHVLGGAEFFKRNYPNNEPRFQAQFIVEANKIYDEIDKLKKVVGFLLSYAQSNLDISEIDVQKIIENLFNEVYFEQFKEKNIETEIVFSENLVVKHNEQFFKDIIQNLISNSIKAVEDNSYKKIIKCTGETRSDHFVIRFSDNGKGISKEDEERVFNIYFTRTENKGGAGIGLYIVKKRIEAMKGGVKVVESEFKPTGTTIEIILPFANKDE